MSEKWVWVPAEPTEKMNLAIYRNAGYEPSKVYAAMLAAAPGFPDVPREEDVIAAKDCDIERMRKRIAKLVRQRDEANEVADYYRQRTEELRGELCLALRTAHGEA